MVDPTVVSNRELRFAQGVSGYFFEADILYTGNNLEICVKEGNSSFVAWIQRVLRFVGFSTINHQRCPLGQTRGSPLMNLLYHFC